MGSSVQADCLCGHHSGTLMIGGGMANYASFCAFPAYCSACRELLVVNLFNQPLTCPHCGGKEVLPYDQPSLIGKLGRKQVASWEVSDKLLRVLVLTDGTYLCPACQKFTLRFMSAGIQWD